jgi:hypothetical protein
MSVIRTNVVALINVNRSELSAWRSTKTNLVCDVVELYAGRVRSNDINRGLKNEVAVTYSEIEGATETQNLRSSDTTT